MNNMKNLDAEDFRKELYDFFNTPEIKKNLEAESKFWDLVTPYLKMTEGEMHKAVPNGAYHVGGSGMVAMTGKGGLIKIILALQKELKTNKMSSIISLDNVGMIIADLNKELAYKSSENRQENKSMLSLVSDGENHAIWLCGIEIWNSKTEAELEDIPLKRQMELNERESFEIHLRLLINDSINMMNKIEM